MILQTYHHESYLTVLQSKYCDRLKNKENQNIPFTYNSDCYYQGWFRSIYGIHILLGNDIQRGMYHQQHSIVLHPITPSLCQHRESIQSKSTILSRM